VTTQELEGAIRDHYDQLNPFYRALWGEHIHHGLFRTPELSRADAQRALIEELVRFAKVPDGADVLDVGCGNGGSSLELAERHGCRCVGITISPVQAEAATEAAARLVGSGRATFRVLDANDLADLRDEAYDVIWCIECSEHIHDKAKLIREWARLLRPGGRVALCAWCEGEGLDEASRSALLDPVCRGMLLPGMLSARRYEEHLRAAGFDDVRSADLTEEVRPTWDLCAAILDRPEVKLLLRVATRRIREFAASFRAMQAAYGNGAMRYAMIAARKPRGR